MMFLQKKLAALAAGVALVMSGGVARAEAPAEAKPAETKPAAPKPFVPFTARRMVLPERVVLPYSHLLVVPAPTPEAKTSIGLTLGMSYGVGPGWMLDAVFAPLKLASAFTYGNPELALTREVHRSKPFELSLSARTFFYSDTSKGGPLGGVELGAPMFFRLGERFRLDVAAYLPISVSQRPIGSLGVTRAGFRTPMSLYYQLHDNFLVALGTGLNARDLGDVATTYSVPVNLSLGFNTNINGFWLDVFPYVALPSFYSQRGMNTKLVAVGLFVDVAKRL